MRVLFAAYKLWLHIVITPHYTRTHTLHQDAGWLLCARDLNEGIKCAAGPNATAQRLIECLNILFSLEINAK